MERLTERSLDYCTQLCSDEDAISCAFYKGEQEEKCWRANMYDRLAAYEGTGLTPEEIESRKEKWNAMTMRERLDSVAKPAQLFDPSLTLEQLKRLDYYDNAEQEGRLIVLPCKVGDTVYQRDHCGEIYEAVVQSIVIDRTRTIFITSGIGFDETAVGKTIFLSRAEAEKALEGVSEDD